MCYNHATKLVSRPIPPEVTFNEVIEPPKISEMRRLYGNRCCQWEFSCNAYAIRCLTHPMCLREYIVATRRNLVHMVIATQVWSLRHVRYRIQVIRRFWMTRGRQSGFSILELAWKLPLFQYEDIPICGARDDHYDTNL